MRQQRAALDARAEIGARSTARRDELLDGLRRGIERVDLAAQRLELGERQLARAAFGAGRATHGAVRVEPRRRERLDAGARERRQQDIRRRREIVLRVPANELEILRERDVALERAGAHAVARPRTLRACAPAHEPGAAMADRERRAPRRLVEAGLQARLRARRRACPRRETRAAARARRGYRRTRALAPAAEPQRDGEQ